ncbi:PENTATRICOPEPTIDE REPEAT-CONTAINING PROTEIN 1 MITOCHONDRIAL, partial [Salix purpurea]
MTTLPFSNPESMTFFAAVFYPLPSKLFRDSLPALLLSLMQFSPLNLPPRVAWTLALEFLCEILRKLVDLGEPLSAHDFYHDHLIARGIEPDSNIVNSMVICLAKLGKLDDAVKLFDRLIGSEDCVLSNAACTMILEGFYEQDKFLEAFDYFVRISDANVKLGMWIYNVLINGLCHQGYVGEAIQVFDIKCKNTGLPPTLHKFKTLFFGLCKKGWLVEAELVFEEMEVQGFFVDKVMYTSLMNAHGKNKKMKMAMRMGLFDKAWVPWNPMSDLGIQPNEVTYNLMIWYYCKQGKLDCAFDYFVRISDPNVKLGMWIYNVLINGSWSSRKGWLVEAELVFEEMEVQGFFVDKVMYTSLMNAH